MKKTIAAVLLCLALILSGEHLVFAQCPIAEGISSPPPARGLQPGPSIEVGKELDGHWLEVGSISRISWNASGGVSPLKVKLEYSPYVYGPWTLIIDSLQANGRYDWEVPIVTEREYFIRATVTDARGDPAFSLNNGFRIIPSTMRGFLTGVVLDESNKSVAGAKVQVEDLEPVVERLTLKNGSFSMELRPGPYRIKISKDGYKTVEMDVVVLGLGEHQTIVRITLPPRQGVDPVVVLGVAVYGLIVLFSMVAFIVLDRKRKMRFRKVSEKKRPPKNKKPEPDDIDRLWEEEDKNERR